MLLNTDIIFVDKTALQEMMRFLDSNNDVAGVCGRYQFPDGSFQRLYNRFPTLLSVFCCESPFSRFKFVRSAPPVRYYRMSDVSFDRDRLVLQPGFACIMIKKDILNRIGFMDEIFPLYYNDVDMCYRMYNAGMKIYYLSSIRVLHSLGASCSKWGNIRSAEYYSSLIRFFKKHKGKVSTFFIQLVILSELIFEKLLDAVRPVFKRPIRTGYSLNHIPEIISGRFSLFPTDKKAEKKWMEQV